MLKVNFDTGNSYLAGVEPYDMLEHFADRVVHVHAKDISLAQASAERGKVTGTPTGCACGDGVVDWQRIIDILAQHSRDIVLSVECTTEAEAVRSLAHLQPICTAANRRAQLLEVTSR